MPSALLKARFPNCMSTSGGAGGGVGCGAGGGDAAGDEVKISRVHERVHPFNPMPIVIPSYEIHIIAFVLCGFPREARTTVVTSFEDVMRLFDGKAPALLHFLLLFTCHSACVPFSSRSNSNELPLFLYW